MIPTAPIQTWLVDHDPLRVVPWTDPVIDRLGYPANDGYVETYWLPVIGPSALWAMRRIGGWLTEAPSGFDMPHGPLAGELGLGHRNGRHSALIRTLARLVAFELAETTPHDQLAVRLRLPPLPRRLALRLPSHLAARHEAEILSATGPRDASATTTCQRSGSSGERRGSAAAGPPLPTPCPSHLPTPTQGADR